MSSSSSSNYSIEEAVLYPLYYSLYAYYPQIVLISLLGVITIFRREMSCNSVYLDGRVIGKRNEEGPLVSLLSSSQAAAQECHDIIISNTTTTTNSRTAKDSSGGGFCSRSSSIAASGGVTNALSNAAASAATTADTCSDSLLLLRQVELLPQDIQMKCFTYLHPKDIIMMSSTNRHFYNLLKCDNSSTTSSFSSVLWFQLFLRDYAWVLSSWKYGKDAVNRSRGMYWRCPVPVATLLKDGNSPLVTTTTTTTTTTTRESGIVKEQNGITCLPTTMKDFYFIFAQTWLEYCIAGRTENPTLVGLHGHVFDMTSFLDQHPGSSETIIMQGAGKDSTSFFEAVGHSKNARSFAIDKLVQVIDLSRCRGGGGREVLGEREGGDGQDQEGDGDKRGRGGIGLVPSWQGCGNGNDIEILPRKRSNKIVIGPETLMTLRQSLDRDRVKQEKMALAAISAIMAKKGEQDIVGSVNVYFDPLCFCWKAWYLNLNFEPVFLHNLSLASEK